jgi:hypothetical protein
VTSEDVARLEDSEFASEEVGDPRRAGVEPFEVRRSTLRTWLVSLLAIPFIVIGVDVLWNGRIVAWLTERIFPDDPQLLEARDDIWAWTMIIVGGAVVVWGLKELFAPAPVVYTDDDGVHVRMRGPFRRPSLLPWTLLHDIDAGTLEDDGDPIEVLIIEVKDGSLLPPNPWAGRRFDERTVALFSTEWETPADIVAERVAEQAITVARHTHSP